MSVLYSLRNLTQQFGEREVLNIGSLDIEAGEIYALLGDNGAGKSTLMRILAFLDSPSGGELIFKGEKAQPGQESRYRPGVVWVPQFPVMFTGSLLHNIEYPMAIKKIPRPERHKKALELLERVKLGHLAKEPAHKLSGGESQRASIARALAAGAEIILFDEPTANVDHRSVGDFIAITRDIWNNGRLSILITTHNANLAATLCPRQIFLSKGRVVPQRILPVGSAWPARLSTSGEGLCLHMPSDAADISFGPRGTLVSLAVFASGTSLSLELAPGYIVNLLLEDEPSQALAGTLTLGSALAIKLEGMTQ